MVNKGSLCHRHSVEKSLEIARSALAAGAQVLFVVGPTASGKSAHALMLAHTLGGEVVCADSQQVYRGMDIGTAKPSVEEQGSVPHHLFDLVDPSEQCTVARYLDAARPLVETMVREKRLPIVVGGTGLYIHALLFGYALSGEGESLEQRETLQRRPLEDLVHELEQIAPNVLRAVDVHNPRRVIRALERARSGGGSMPRSTPPEWKSCILGISMEPDVLRRRIAERVTGMFQRGFFEEVRALVDAYGPPAPGLRALGYKDCLAVIRGIEPREGLEARIALRTAQYAKRQRTWFRKTPGVRWISSGDPCVRCDPGIAPVG